MKAIVDPAILGKELKKISPVVGKNQVMPILACVKLDFNGKELTITGTDLNTWISHTMECENKKPFSLAIEISDLIEICDKSAGPITIVSEETQTKFLRDKGSAKLPIYGDPKDFPSVEQTEYFLTMDVDGPFFYALHGASSCSGRDALRPQMQGAGLDFNKTNLSVVGLDGFILRKQDFKIPTVKKPFVVSVNTVFCNLVKSFQESTLSVSEKFIKAEYDNTSVVTRLSESRYIDYNVILQSDTGKFNYKIDRKELLASISKLSIAADKSHQVSFIFKDDGLQLYSRDNITSKESDELITNIGEIIEHADVLLNTKYLSTILNTITEDVVLLNFQQNPKTPIYIQPEGDATTRLMIATMFIQ